MIEDNKVAYSVSSIQAEQFLSIDRDDVVISAFKPAELAKDSLVLRIRDIGGKGGHVIVDTKAVKPSPIFTTDLLERDTGELEMQNGCVRLNILQSGYATLRFKY